MATMETHYDPEHRIRRHIVTGVFDAEQMIEAISAVYRSDEVPIHAHVLWDLTAADMSNVTAAEVRRGAEFGRGAWEENPGYRIAIVVASDLSFGLTRMFEQIFGIFDEQSICIFRRREEAESWLMDAETPD